MGTVGRFLLGLLAFGALYLFGARLRGPVIEADIQSRTSAAMAQAGFGEVVVSTDGRDVTLTGSVSDDEAVEAAGDVAWDTRGVRVVDNRLGAGNVVAAASGAYGTSFCKSGGRLVLEGSVPTAAERDRVAREAALLFPIGEVDDRLGIRPGAPEDYESALQSSLTEVVQLDEGCVRLDGTTAEFAGSVRSEEAAERIRDQGRAVEALGFDVSYQLDVPTFSEEAAMCQAAWRERLAPGERVLFGFDDAELHEEGRRLLQEIAEISELCPDVDVWVTGHTDAVGDREYNIQLSRERARVVVDYLISIGVDADRLTPVGYGFSQPVADNSTEEGRALNRRIEFRVREG
jgi:outer membrane protein OmpA-like peptidoglycan-associated protein